MALRLTSSSLTLATSQTDTEIASTITDLDKLVPAKATATPLGWIFSGSIDSGITVKEVKVVSVDNPEAVYRIYSGPHIPLADLADALKPSTNGVPVSSVAFNPDHGLKLVLVYSSGGTGATLTVLWKIANDPGGSFPAAGVAGLTVAAGRGGNLGAARGNLNPCPTGCSPSYDTSGNLVCCSTGNSPCDC